MLSAHLGRAVRTTVPMPVHQIAHSLLVRSSYKKKALSGRAAATKAARLVAFPAVSLNDERRYFVSKCHPLWSRVQIYDSLAVEECGGSSPQFWGIEVRGKGLKRGVGVSPALQNPEIRKNTE